MSAPATVAVCRCGHGERMHERDEGADGGRGNCMHGSCGCAEFRTGQAVASVAQLRCTDPGCTLTFMRADARDYHVELVHRKAEPVAPRESPAKVEKPSEPLQPAARPHRCDECSESFDRAQGLGSHRRYKHSDKPKPDTRPDLRPTTVPAAKATEPTPTPPEPEPEPEAAPDGPVEAQAAPLTPPDPVPAPTPAEAPAPAPARRGRVVKDARSITIEFPAGWVEMNYEIDWTRTVFDERAVLAEWTSGLHRLGHVDYFAAQLGDPDGDEFEDPDQAIRA